MKLTHATVMGYVIIYEKALEEETRLKYLLIALQAETARLKAETINLAYEAGLIDERNSNTRARGELTVLSENILYSGCMANCNEAERDLAKAENRRKVTEASMKMVKAWLYSQAGLGNL